MNLNAANSGQRESLNHNTPLSTKENGMKIKRTTKVVEYEAFDCDVMVLLAIAEVAAEYLTKKEVL